MKKYNTEKIDFVIYLCTGYTILLGNLTSITEGVTIVGI